MVFSVLSIAEISEGNNIWVGSHNEIEIASNLNSTNPTLYSEINSSYQEAYDRTMDLSSYNLFRLDYGAFNKTFNMPDVDQESINIIEMTFMTNGLVYTVDGDDINLTTDLDWSLDPSNDYSLPGVSTQPLAWYWWICIAAGAITLLNSIKMRAKTRNLLIVASLILLLLLYLGILTL
jgi:hypothetical protein